MTATVVGNMTRAVIVGSWCGFQVPTQRPLVVSITTVVPFDSF